MTDAVGQLVLPREYRIDPVLRRCCCYSIAGIIAIAVETHWIRRFMNDQPNQNGPADFVFDFAPHWFLIGLLVLPLIWKMRIDHEGVSRWMVFRLDLWTWNDLAGGGILKFPPFHLYDPGRPRWNRWLRLKFLAYDDEREVITLINSRYRLPAPPPVPESLMIHYAGGQTAEFDHGGIRLTSRRSTCEYTWDEVLDVHVTRYDPMRRNFVRLVLTLPNHEVDLRVLTETYGGRPAWRHYGSDQ